MTVKKSNHIATIEHVTPLSSRSLHLWAWSNLAAACMPYNTGRHSPNMGDVVRNFSVSGWRQAFIE
jgi:hypothetical protein